MKKRINTGDKYSCEGGTYECCDRGLGVIRGMRTVSDDGGRRRKVLEEMPEEKCTLIPPRGKRTERDGDR